MKLNNKNKEALESNALNVAEIFCSSECQGIFELSDDGEGYLLLWRRMRM